MKKMEQQRELSLESMIQLRESILEEFLLIANHLNKQLSMLIENSIDQEKFICLDKRKETESNFKYVYLSRSMVESFQRTIENLLAKKQKEMMPKKFLNITSGKYFSLSFEYREIESLVNLADSFEKVNKSIYLLQMLEV